MARPKRKYFELHDKIYGHVAHVYLGYSFDEVAKLHPKKRKLKDMYLDFEVNQDCPACHITIDNEPLRSLLVFQDRKPETWIVSHEAVHATRFVFDSCSMEHNYHTDEAFACFQSYLVREILEKL